MKNIKIALIVGHNSSDGGAYSNTLKINEFNYFKKVAEYIKENLDCVTVIHRTSNSSYISQMTRVLSVIEKNKFDIAFELHFNGAKDTNAHGAETLYSNKFECSEKIANLITNNYNLLLGLRKRKNPLITSTKQRGGYPIIKSPIPYLLIESFFGSNVSDCNKVKDHTKVGDCILKSIDKILQDNMICTNNSEIKKPNNPIDNKVNNKDEQIKSIAKDFINNKYNGFSEEIKSKLFESIFTTSFNNIMTSSQSEVFKNKEKMLLLNDKHLLIFSEFYNNTTTIDKFFSECEIVITKDVNKYSITEFNYLYNSEKLNKYSDTVYRIINILKDNRDNINQNNGLLSTDLDKANVVDDKVIEEKEIELETAINSISIEPYSMDKKLVELKFSLDAFIKLSTIESEKSIVETFYKNLLSKCNETSDLKLYQDQNLKFLEDSLSKFIFDTKNSNGFIDICMLVKIFCEIYKLAIQNEFSRTYFLLTGSIQNAENNINIKPENYNSIINSFFYNDKYNVEKEEVNPISYIFKKSEFLNMKKHDYDNLRAYLSRVPMKPTKTSCDKTFILIYGLLLLGSMKNESFKRVTIEKENDDIETKIARHFFNMKNKKWKHDYSDTEKFFSMLYPFVEYKNNHFTAIMKDKEFNKSQEHSKKLRKDVEKEAAKIIDKIKTVFYESYDGKSNYGVYSIFQGLADLAYELSTPMTFRVDFTSVDVIENIIQSFLNACVSSIEMQTTLLIYDFIFNFGINIGGKNYSLNDLNNIIKTLNLVINISKKDVGTYEFYNTRIKLVENSGQFQSFKNLGFLTYDKNLNFLVVDEIEEIELTGYYLSDEKFGFNEFEYIRRKGEECSPGNRAELIRRYNNLNYYEKVSMYANYLFSKSKEKDITYDINNSSGNGYLNIVNFYKHLQAEANNIDVDVIKMPIFLYNILTDINANNKDFKLYVDELRNISKRFFYNSKKNENKIKEYIAKNLSEDKIVDWTMKMLPSYELIAKAFGLKSASNISTLDSFIDSLMQFMNLIIGITFDKWKSSTLETIEVRRIKMIERERYYYLQSIPILIDWLVSNMEKNIIHCSKTLNDYNNIDYDAVEDNLEKMEYFENEVLLRLKHELGFMSGYQLKIVKDKLEKSLITIESLTPTEVKKLVSVFTGFEKEDIEYLKSLSTENRIKIMELFSNYLD
ncbi:MAG: N-acetylmuramoyl-L-alanine amidase [Cetobacterium sp.]